MKKRLLCIIALMLLCSGCAYAVEDDGNSVIVPNENSYKIFSQVKRNQVNTLDNYIDNLRNSSIDIDVYTRRDIERLNNPSLGDILQQSAGVVVNTNNGSDGNITKVRIRGTDRVRLQIDGLRADRTTGIGYAAETQFLNTDDLEAIEVIKGPQGNVLGTNSLGGSINMQTRRGYGPFKMELGSEIGELGTFKERLAFFGEYKKLDYYLSTTYYKTSGGMRTSDLGRLRNDSYRNFHFVSNLGYKLFDDKAEIRNIFRLSNAKKGLGYGYGNGWSIPNYNDPNNYARNLDIMENLSFKHTVNNYYDYNLRVGIYQNNNYNYYSVPDNINPYDWGYTKYRGNRFNFMTQHNFNLADWNKLSVGYNLENEYAHFSSQSGYLDPIYGYTDGYNSHYSTFQNDVYINDAINIKDKLFIRGGVRYINNNRYGNYIVPNGSAALVLPTFKLKGATTKFRGSWGQSVNNPSLYQKYTVPSPYLLPNKDLSSEKISGWDIGIEQSFWEDRIKFDFGYFNSNYKDYIAYISNPITWVGQYQNIERAKIYGYEGKFIFEPNDIFKFVMNYTYTGTEDKSTGFDLPQAPNNTYSATLYYTPFRERWDIYAGLVTTSSRRVSGGTNPNNRVNGILDVRLGTKLRLVSFKGFHVYFRVDVLNLFNQKNCVYRENDVYFYSPKARARFGLYIEYDQDKQKEIDELKAQRQKRKLEKTEKL